MRDLLDRLDIDHILTIEYRLERGEIGNRAELDRPIEAQRRSPTWRLHRHPDRPEACPSKPRRQLKVAVPTVLVDEQDCGTWLSSSTSLQRPGSPAFQHRSSVGTTSRGSPHRGLVGRHGSDRTGRTNPPSLKGTGPSEGSANTMLHGHVQTARAGSAGAVGSPKSGRAQESAARIIAWTSAQPNPTVSPMILRVSGSTRTKNGYPVTR